MILLMDNLALSKLNLRLVVIQDARPLEKEHSARIELLKVISMANPR
jgi:hypothetical protein